MNAAEGALLGAALGLPLVMLLACLSSPLRARMPALLAIAPVPALTAALLATGGTLALPPMLLRLRFALDVPVRCCSVSRRFFGSWPEFTPRHGCAAGPTAGASWCGGC